MDDVPIQDLSRVATVQIVNPVVPAPPPPPPPTPVSTYLPAIPLTPEPVLRPPGDLPRPYAATILPNTTVAPTVQSTNLAPDISTFYSANEPYFQLTQDVVAPGDVSGWYLFPTQNGTIQFDVSGGTNLLEASGNVIAYDGQSLMPSTWYLNPALNGQITLVDACGNNLLQSINGDLYYNAELLAKANDLQNIADWSYYAALNPAGVDFDGHAIYNASDISGASAHIGSITGTTGAFGNITFAGATGTSINVSGGATVGSLTSNGIINASSHQIQNTTAITIGPGAVGTLTSPDAVVLQWNGNNIATGAGGDVSQWSTFKAVSTIDASSNAIINSSSLTGTTTSGLAIASGGSQSLTVSSSGGDVTTTAYNNIAENAGANYNVTVDRGASIGLAAGINLTAQNGLGGNIVLNSNGGYSVLGQQVGFGAITLNALGASNQAFGLGGKIDLNAYSAAAGEYGGFTSRVSASAATIALSAGAAPTLPGLAGSMNIFGNGAVSIVSSIVPPILPQVPETIYMYGLAGVRLESPAGVQSLSDFYAGNVYPIAGGDLVLQGRTLPNGYVRVEDCTNIDMVGAGAITGVVTINGSAYPPPAGVGPTGPTGPTGPQGPTGPTGSAANAALWSTFPAVSNVDISGFDITNVDFITGYPATPISITSTNDIVLQASNDVSIDALTGSANLNGNIDANVNASSGVVNLISLTGVNVLSCPLNMTSNKIVNLAAGTVSGDAVNYGQLTFRDSTEFYVSGQGSDVSGNGSILAPFLTIQKAITQAELISSAALICVINVASGHYTENLTFNKGYVVLNGSLQTQTGNEVCEITGSISIACVGANDVFNRQVAFQGFNITCGAGQFISNTSTSSHTVAFQDCKVFVDGVFYSSSATSADMRTYFTNMEITSTNTANVATVITTNVGLTEFERVDLTVNGNAIGIAVAGTSILNRCSLSTLDNTNSAVILKPLINITSSTTSTHSLGNVAFAFTSAVAKTNSSALAIASSINTAILMFNCLFTLAGTANSTNNCVSYNGVGSPTIAGVNNTSLSVNVALPQAVTVQSGITQIQYININPPGLACYSSTADQVIAVSGTPQALTYTTTQFNQGTTLLANSRVYANAQGNYALSYSVELQHTGAGATQTATIFLKKNGTTIANTGRQWSIASGSTQIAASAEFVVALNSGDYVEVFFSGDTSLSANATAAAGALPAVPSVVFNIKQFR